ncbi:hypothetical protein DL95DRAFT_381141 [Leptodontidium sp. 2 PMI_412]|nr:hypothetical protein DL95DRAFT_381141 [Leptodontidium sp. 2 PMI_412]
MSRQCKLGRSSTWSGLSERHSFAFKYSTCMIWWHCSFPVGLILFDEIYCLAKYMHSHCEGNLNRTCFIATRAPNSRDNLRWLSRSNAVSFCHDVGCSF